MSFCVAIFDHDKCKSDASKPNKVTLKKALSAKSVQVNFQESDGFSYLAHIKGSATASKSDSKKNLFT